MPKISNFYPLYGEKLKGFVGRDMKFLEIGVQDGSSIAHWRRMSPSWKVFGLDTDPNCGGEGITTGSQEDREVLRQFEGFDIVIDDGGHTWKQQIETFEQLFPTMPKGSLYVIEDLHTSFWPEFADYHVSTVDYLTKLVPHINHRETNNDRLKGNSLLVNNGIASIEFYPSIAFIWKD